jgi:2-polyprenyl-3-methyl-5-hydroxy-6-metoxy-1,4-benzoquinol methylase
MRAVRAGVFAGMLQHAGFETSGIGVSHGAVSRARKQGQASEQTATLSGFRPEHGFDVVLCLDVLLHVVEDAEWALSLAKLADCVAPEGLLMFIETFDHTGLRSAPHVRWRRREEYLPVLAQVGFSLVDEVVFQSPHERVNKTLTLARRT